MKKILTIKLIVAVLLIATLAGCGESLSRQNQNDMTEELKQSLVFLDISDQRFDTMQPWKLTDISPSYGYGIAVGENEVLTTAWNVVDAAFIKVKRFGQNEFIGAEVKVIDHELNLCLLTLDAEMLDEPLKPIKFEQKFEKAGQLNSYWLTSGGNLTTSRAVMDRAEVWPSTISYSKVLNYIAAATPNSSGRSEIFCLGKSPIGIACWANGDSQEAGIITAETINNFLAGINNGDYKGFAAAGFSTKRLIDPAARKYLKMPDDLKHGVYVSKVYKLGTGSDVLKEADVILAINSKQLNPYGRYLDQTLDRLSYHHIISQQPVGAQITFDIFRDGKEMQVTAAGRKFKASEMLVPHYTHGFQQDYFVSGGLVFQRLTRDYLMLWGDNWPGACPSYLYNYFRNQRYNPTEREQIVILSYVLPTEQNVGYHQLGRIVLEKVNGKEINAIEDIIEARKTPVDDKYDVYEFEQDYPAVVIDRSELPMADEFVRQNYGVSKQLNMN